MDSHLESGIYWAQRLSLLAEQSLLIEAVLSPKPGLVDASDTGSHSDMDIYTFIQSATSFSPSFFELAKLGLTYKGSPLTLLPRIREIGIQAENEMFITTKGINTHKGAIFSLGILLTSCGLYLQSNKEVNRFTPTDTYYVIEIVKKITKGLVDKELSDLEKKRLLTNGEMLFQKYGITGVRGEVEEGFPSITEVVMPYLRESQDQKTSDRLLNALFLLMTITEDSNIIFRSDIKKLKEVQQLAKNFIEKGGMKQANAVCQIQYMNEQFKKWNISPGGSADLLSVAIFISKLEDIL